jgi:hypothetical protein
MKFRGLIIAVAVLLALGGGLYWSNHHKPSEKSGTLSSSSSPSILKLNRSSITQVTLTGKGTAPVTLVKQNDGKWQITKPKELRADQDEVSGLLASLASLNADRVVEEGASGLAQYGLAEPSFTVDIATSDRKQRQLVLGDASPAGGDIYAMLSGDPRVFTIAEYSKTGIDKGLNDLRDKRLLTMEPDKISRITFEKKGQAIEFARIKDGWQILQPQPMRADSFAVDEFARSVADVRMDLSGSENNHDAATKFGQGTPVATVTLNGDQGAQTMELRKNKDDYFAKSSAIEGVYKVDPSLGTTLGQSLNDFRNKKLFDFGFEDPGKVEMHEGQKSWFLLRNGNDWWSNGRKMDSTAVESLVEKLRDLSATGFPSAGFSSPNVEVTVTSGNGKRTEKVLIAKSGDNYIARRGDEPSLYQLNASDVNDLTAAADAIKPAGTSKR